MECQLKKLSEVVNGILLAVSQTSLNIELGAAVIVMLPFSKRLSL